MCVSGLICPNLFSLAFNVRKILQLQEGQRRKKAQSPPEFEPSTTLGYEASALTLLQPCGIQLVVPIFK